MPDGQHIQFARTLRSNSTEAERRIWSYLRAHRLDGHSFRRQHPIGDYTVDFYCHAARLVVELDGGQHYQDEGVERDRRRTRAIEEMGLRVIRFSNHDALKHSEAVARMILREVEQQLGLLPPP